ncbi:MAG: MiaB/RimO family radical SAM methylthiotransferase [Acidobacteria bacterium]|nr:MiaB/RimO family radical SAM methylthiotransferase [Acidobacteriota bacterium]
MASTFHIENFGCRAARADGEAIAALLRKSGATEGVASSAEVVIVNTCSVTAEADREARAWIRRAHRHNPEARIIATGCYAQRAPEELAALPGIAAVIGNSHKALAPEIALSMMPGSGSSNALVQIQAVSAGSAAPQVLADDAFAHSFLEEAPIIPGAQTRPNLKIQEGCSNRCSFCVIPQTRGNSRSLSSSAVLQHVRGFVEAGGNELVLSGINLGRWGRELDRSSSEPRTLAALVRAIFDRTVLPRLRLSSIEPMDWDADLIAVVKEHASSRLAQHVHLPLQSGSDAVLRRMHRRYRPWHYAEKVAELMRAAGPGLTVGADVMAGFPGETDREFQESYDFISSLPFGYLHLFPFSPRPGTRAGILHNENPVPSAVVRERIAALRSLAAQKAHAHRAQFMGTELEAITLHTPAVLAARGRTSALTDNFLPVELVGELDANQLVSIRVTGIAPDDTLLASPTLSNTSVWLQTATTEPVLENAF